MKTLLEILKLSTEYLTQKGISHPRRQAEELLMDSLSLSRLQLYLEYDRPLNPEELTLCRNRLQRRGKGEPLAYIHGIVDFLDCKIHVTPDVLIPRQETEILADLICKTLENEELSQKTLWDVCCGSGCLGISIKKRLPQLQVILSDISMEALKVARKNAEFNQVDVTCIQGDLLSPFAGKKTDYLVSNPPYISLDDYNNLDHEVKNFEPKLALIAEDGYQFYRRFAEQLSTYLNTKSKVWLEVGTGQGEALHAIFDQPIWKKKEIKADWAGHDRFFFLEIE